MSCDKGLGLQLAASTQNKSQHPAVLSAPTAQLFLLSRRFIFVWSGFPPRILPSVPSPAGYSEFNENLTSVCYAKSFPVFRLPWEPYAEKTVSLTVLNSGVIHQHQCPSEQSNCPVSFSLAHHSYSLCKLTICSLALWYRCHSVAPVEECRVPHWTGTRVNTGPSIPSCAPSPSLS